MPNDTGESAAARELQGHCRLVVGLRFGGRVQGFPCTLYFSYAAIRLARESQRLGVRRGRMAQLMLARHARLKSKREYHSSLVLSYLFWCVWHLRSCSRPACDASGPKIETAAEGQFGGFTGRAYCLHRKLNLDLDPGTFRDLTNCFWGLPTAISNPTFHD